MRSCSATIMLRAEHAPSVLPPPEPPPREGPERPPRRVPGLLPLALLRTPQPRPLEPPTATSDLRRFRMQRLPQANGINGHQLALNRNFNSVGKSPVKEEMMDDTDTTQLCGSKLRQLLEIQLCKEDVKNELAVEGYSEIKCDTNVKEELAVSEIECQVNGIVRDKKCKVQLPVWKSVEAEAEEKAAAFFRRAVLLCRASLYPGLHTILAGERQCAWCWRRRGARRCLWYGPPPESGTPRAARKVRGRRYLCACCPSQSNKDNEPLSEDAGWYGKGYRKGRRKKR